MSAPLFRITVDPVGPGLVGVKASHRGRNVHKAVFDCAGCLTHELEALVAVIGEAVAPSSAGCAHNAGGLTHDS